MLKHFFVCGLTFFNCVVFGSLDSEKQMVSILEETFPLLECQGHEKVIELTETQYPFEDDEEYEKAFAFFPKNVKEVLDNASKVIKEEGRVLIIFYPKESNLEVFSEKKASSLLSQDDFQKLVEEHHFHLKFCELQNYTISFKDYEELHQYLKKHLQNEVKDLSFIQDVFEQTDESIVFPSKVMVALLEKGTSDKRS